ncbi:MAG: hypothetical protein AAGD07_21900 [Planctomycetota bacterium]
MLDSPDHPNRLPNRVLAILHHPPEVIAGPVRRASDGALMFLMLMGSVAIGVAVFTTAAAAIQTICVAASFTSFIALSLCRCVAAVIALTITLFAAPSILRDTGYCLTRLVPNRFQEKLRMRSLEDHRIQVRSMLIILVSLPLVTLMATSVAQRFAGSDAALTFVAHECLSSVLAASIILAVAGIFIAWFGPHLYRTRNQVRIKRAIRHHRRGIALRSFIAAWDNPSRRIYDSCRLSRRLSVAHRAIVFTASACFAGAVCLLVLVADSCWHALESTPLPLIVSSFALATATLGILWVWPTTNRMVDFAGAIVDPFLASDREEFEYFD